MAADISEGGRLRPPWREPEFVLTRRDICRDFLSRPRELRRSMRRVLRILNDYTGRRSVGRRRELLRGTVYENWLDNGEQLGG